MGDRPGLPAVVVLAAALAAGCASGGAVPQPFPGSGRDPAARRPDPEHGRTSAATGARAGRIDPAALTQTALALQGIPYRHGGSTPEGFDCSGFVQYVFARHGLELPRETREQFRLGYRVDRDRLEPGDLVFFTTVAPGASHVGIVVDASRFVHAPSSDGVVRVERLDAGYWRARFVGARRPH